MARLIIEAAEQAYHLIAGELLMALQGEALLSDALSRHLATLTTDPTTAVAWDGMPFDPNDGSNRPYLEVKHLPNTTRSNTFGESKDLQGILAITVVGNVWKRSGDLTPFDLRNIATQVVAHFPTTLVLRTAEHRIECPQPGSLQSDFPDGSDWRVPINIFYRATTLGA